MKKHLLILFCAVLAAAILALTACGGTSGNETTGGAAGPGQMINQGSGGAEAEMPSR